MAIASLVLGIFSFLFTITPPLTVIAPILGIIGIILGVTARKKQKAAGEPVGLAKAGLITSAVTTFISLIVCLACGGLIYFLASKSVDMQKNSKNIDKSPRPIEKILRGLGKISE